MFKLDPKKMEKMMARLGVKTEAVPAEEVVIRTDEKEIVIKKPNVQKVEMAGQTSFQISGEITEKSAETAKEKFSQEDVKLVAKQAAVSEKEARAALEKSQGDIAQAILELKKK